MSLIFFSSSVGARPLRNRYPAKKCVNMEDENGFKVVPAGRMGKGLISCKDIPENAFVIEYKGHLLTNKRDYDSRNAELTKEGKESYLMEIKVRDGKTNWLVDQHKFVK